MRIPLQNANQLTLNRLKECLNPAVRKPAFLQMLFPAALRDADQTHLLDFIYDADTSFRNARTSFLTGNIVRYSDQTYSRAHQAELRLIAAYLHDASQCESWISHLETQFRAPAYQAVSALIPLDAARYPQPFADELHAADQPESVHRLIFLLLLWAVFGERIQDVSGIFTMPAKPQSDSVKVIPDPDFLIQNTADLESVRGVDIAFHTGDIWLTDIKRIDILLRLIRQSIPLRFLVDGSLAAELMSDHMRHSDRIVLSREMKIGYWRMFQERYPDAISVRISDLPMLRNYFHIRREPESLSAMRVIYYTYGISHIENNYHYYPEYDSQFYRLYANEYDYLWERGIPIGDWKP